LPQIAHNPLGFAPVTLDQSVCALVPFAKPKLASNFSLG